MAENSGSKGLSGDNALKVKSVPINKSSSQDQFFHFWDVSDLDLSAGDQLEYYFEIWDNDEINGSKSTRTESKIFKAPTLKEISEKTERNES